VVVTASSANVGKIEALASEYSFFAARIGTTGGSRVEILVDREPFISVPLAELAQIWSSALEANLRDEVPA
jgi:hypothetical protein